MDAATQTTQDSPELTRQQRGRRIAERMRIKALPYGFVVPSEAGPSSYVVKDGPHGRNCTCPDFELRREPCKHIYAVQYARTATTMPDGSTAVVETLQVNRITYQQNWPAYNLAQTHEKERAMELLRALCDGIAEPPRPPKRGNQPLPVKDRLFAMVAKVYGTMSTRRTDTDMREYASRGMLAKPISYNAVIDSMDDATLTPILVSLITESARPLRAVESQFAVDSTGFSTQTYVRWYDEKYGKERSKAHWLKGHALIGCKTNVICSAKVTHGHDADSPEFIPLLKAAAEHFDMREISADKAYGSYENMKSAQALGVAPFIAFKMDARGDGPTAPAIWRRMFSFFEFQREAFLRHYHQRSNVESTFSMCKRKFGGALRSKTPVAQENEVLCKFIAHNLACLVSAACELGIAPLFWQDEAATDDLPSPLPAREIRTLPAESESK